MPLLFRSLPQVASLLHAYLVFRHWFELPLVFVLSLPRMYRRRQESFSRDASAHLSISAPPPTKEVSEWKLCGRATPVTSPHPLFDPLLNAGCLLLSSGSRTRTATSRCIWSPDQHWMSSRPFRRIPKPRDIRGRPPSPHLTWTVPCREGPGWAAGGEPPAGCLAAWGPPWPAPSLLRRRRRRTESAWCCTFGPRQPPSLLAHLHSQQRGSACSRPVT